MVGINKLLIIVIIKIFKFVHTTGKMPVLTHLLHCILKCNLLLVGIHRFIVKQVCQMTGDFVAAHTHAFYVPRNAATAHLFDALVKYITPDLLS